MYDLERVQPERLLGVRERIGARDAVDDRLGVDDLPVVRVALGERRRRRAGRACSRRAACRSRRAGATAPAACRSARSRSAPRSIAVGQSRAFQASPASSSGPCDHQSSAGVIASSSTASAATIRGVRPSSPSRGVRARQHHPAGGEEPHEQRRHLPVPVDAGVHREHRPARDDERVRVPLLAPQPQRRAHQHGRRARRRAARARRRPAPPASRGTASARRSP